jgi:hypothetical protein
MSGAGGMAALRAAGIMVWIVGRAVALGTGVGGVAGFLAGDGKLMGISTHSPKMFHCPTTVCFGGRAAFAVGIGTSSNCRMAAEERGIRGGFALERAKGKYMMKSLGSDLRSGNRCLQLAR